ncbi:cilia- and flagella-associated protein 61-like isoform X3 [Halichondria panicea]|uniref:cilia- and flagella-associated protein 61-like isoform X3 n=1 Tax=Halichondria panicea TaxID=6063 RepID=UPI00312B3E48
MATVQKFVSKRSESSDAGGVRGLITRHTEALFGRVNPEHIIEHASLGISLLSGEGSLVGHMSLTDTLSTLPTDWTSWLNSDLYRPSPVNTLFLCLFVAKDNFHQGAVTEILRTVYMTAPLLQYLLLVTPTHTHIGPALSSHFSPLCCQEDLAVYATHRHTHFPTLYIRPACVEDSDDLLPILVEHSHNITSLYGDYFLSELIASQDTDHQTLVAEVDGHAVGVMSVTTCVDIDLLTASYVLEPYHLLRKPHPQDTILSSQDTAHTSTAHTSTAHIDTAHTSTSTAHADTAHTSTSTAHADTAHTSTSTAHADTAHTSTSTADSCLSQESCAENTPDNSTLEEVQGSKVDTKVYSLQGEACAVAIQLFAIDERYEMRSVDFLPAVFKLFPEHEFLLLTQPHSSGDLPLLTHFTEAVPPRPGTCLPQELFLAHKASLLDSFIVREATTVDLPALKALTFDLSSRDDMLGDVEIFLRARRDLGEVTPLLALVAEVDSQLVALAVLREKEDMEYICSHYNIEDFIYYNYHEPRQHSHLHHLVLNPAFSPHAKHFLKEILRLSNSSCLYYHLSSDSQPKPQSLISALHCLIPIKARRQVVYPEGLGINAPLPEVTGVKPPFALYHTNRKLTFEPKISINCRVVIVGASQTAISLLETLIFCPHLHFSNVVLVSPTDVPSPPTIGLDTWINTVLGTLTAINRTDHCVEVVCGGCKFLVHYDWLVLTCGVQYTAPPLKGLPPPTQVITVPTHTKAGSCVVFGSGVDAYTSVQHLLSEGVAPDMITMLRPHTLEWTEGVIAQRVSESLSLTGIHELSDINLTEWIVGEGGLEAVAIENATGHAQTIPCQTLIYHGDKTVNTNAFKALNDSCLVFDNRLVISRDHLTNDPHILAAGPLTKYSRKYRVGNCSHADFNSDEVGLKLALTLLSKLDPTFDPTSDDPTDSLLIPRYTQPVIVGGALPGGLHFLHISAPPTPGTTPPSHTRPLPRKGRELMTDTASGYFQLHISEYGRVDELCLLSSQPINERDNYTCLYNIHEKYLNNLLERYDLGLVSDLYNYFRESWVCAVIHDRFPDLMQEVREDLTLVPAEPNNGSSIETVVRDMFDGGSPLTSVQLTTQFNTSSAKALVSQRLIRYLNYNQQQLPMFTKPDTV